MDRTKHIFDEYRSKFPPFSNVEDLYLLSDQVIGQFLDKITDCDPHLGRVIRMKLQDIYLREKEPEEPLVKWYKFIGDNAPDEEEETPENIAEDVKMNEEEKKKRIKQKEINPKKHFQMEGYFKKK